MTLRLRGTAAVDAAEIVVKLDGKEIDRFTSSGSEFDRTFTVSTAADQMWSLLTIETSKTAVPNQVGQGNDTRELGLQVSELTWRATDGATPRSLDPALFLGEGWYALEQVLPKSSRWAMRRAVAHLPSVHGDGQLELTLLVPTLEDGTRAQITVTVGGEVIDTFSPPAGQITKSYRVPQSVHKGQRSELVLSADKALALPRDSRELAMSIYTLTWMPAGAESK
jgi:hypothetical protein